MGNFRDIVWNYKYVVYCYSSGSVLIMCMHELGKESSAWPHGVFCVLSWDTVGAHGGRRFGVTRVQWTDPQLSIMIIYNSKWSILNQ